LFPANADTKPTKFEFWAARKSLHATLAREAPKTANPVPLSESNLLAGLKLYKQNCGVCHGTGRGDASQTNIAKGLYQKAPQLATNGVEDDPDGVTYWKVKHGIRLTGMPAFGRTLSEKQLWQVTLFLKHMDHLPKTVAAGFK
jgi:mono/diheme cytochrome c family protein